MTHENLIGRTVAGYRLLKHIGEGGTATVYKAEHGERGTTAVKILRSRMGQDPVAVKRFLREAEYGARVIHPNIVTTYDFGEADGLNYLALEWAEGESLSTFATRAGPLAPDVVLNIIQQLGGALSAAHKAGIIHRDLKPANIMYDPATGKVKLLDFGIARDAELQPEERLTRAGFFVGTLQYVAPEALSGELVDEQADVYSLATITYYLLAGSIPYNGRSPRELFQQLLTQPPTPLSQAARGVRISPELEAAVMKGLERDRSARYRSIDNFVEGVTAAITRGEERKEGFLSGLFRRR